MEVSASGDSNMGPHERLTLIEDQELEAPQGRLPNETYCEFLALYILHDDFNNSKLLWKRIPGQCKEESAELKALWEVCKAFWKRDFSNVFQQCVAFTWTDTVQIVIDEVVKRNREKCLHLVSQAYTTISVETLATLLNCTPQECIQIALLREWNVSEDQKVISPVRVMKKAGTPIDNEAHLEKLTQYISFLET